MTPARTHSRSSVIIAPMAGLALLFAVWELAVRWLGLSAGILPSPIGVLRILWMNLTAGALQPHIAATLSAAAQGLAIAISAGIFAGILVAESRTLDRFVYPVVVGIQAMPIVAIAPLLIVWLGFGLGSKIGLVAISCFFPIFIQTVAGLRSTPKQLVDLYRVYGAGRWRTLVDIKLPSAVDHLFAGLQVALVLSLTASVVGEFLAARAGLGYLIKSVSSQMDVTLMFACVLVLGAIGFLAALAARTLHRRIKFWTVTLGKSA